MFYSECICLPLPDEWLHAANRPVEHSVRRGRIHPQVPACILKCFLKDEQQQQRWWMWSHSSTNMCVCEIRIGELREAMDDILHKQCDYDPASGESFDFDRFEHSTLGCSYIADAKRSQTQAYWACCKWSKDQNNCNIMLVFSSLNFCFQWL